MTTVTVDPAEHDAGALVLAKVLRDVLTSIQLDLLKNYVDAVLLHAMESEENVEDFDA